LEGELLFGFGKILYQPPAAKDLDSCFDKIETHFLVYISTLNFDLRKLSRQTLDYSQPNYTHISL
jgi:hypothetical protein